MVPEAFVSELLVIVAICPLVFGAEHLPGFARSVGSFIRRHTDRSRKPE
jgi:Sec-independent protein translocase protein TatA